MARRKYSFVVLCLFFSVLGSFASQQHVLASEGSYLVTISASEGVQVYPAGVQAVQEGEEINLSVLPDSPDVIPFLIVDGARRDLEQVEGEFRFPLRGTGNHDEGGVTSVE